MLKSIDLYNEAMRITKCGSAQKQVFNYWANHNSDLTYESMSFDAETTGITFGAPSILHYGGTDIHVNNIRPFGFSLCIPTKDKLALVWARLGTPLYNETLSLLSIKGIKSAHNLRYDLRVCRINDIKVRPSCNCTLTMARIHWNTRMKFNLKTLTYSVCPDLYGYDEPLKRALTNMKSSYTRAGYPKNYVNLSFLPDEMVGKYSVTDSFICWLLNLELMPKMIEQHKEIYKREKKVISIFMGIEERGFAFDRRQAKIEIRKLEKQVPKLIGKLELTASKKFNPNSPAQVLKILTKNLKIPKNLLRKKDGKLTTEKETLELAVNKLRDKRAKKFVKTLLNLRSIQKLVGTYLKPLLKRAEYNLGIIYCNLNPTDTRTGRVASSDPNLQNIPRPTSGFTKYNSVRKCFITRPGFDLYFPDYKQMEMWLFALTADEKVMLKGLLAGKDFHVLTAVEMLGPKAYDENGEIKYAARFKFKQVNFGIIYGMGDYGLATYISIPLRKAKKLRAKYLKTFPAVQEVVKRNKKELKTKGYVTDIFGKRYNIDPRKAYKAINAQVQGGCAQIIKTAMINLKYLLASLPSYNGLRVRMILQVHDELVFEIPKAAGKATPMILKGIDTCMSEIPELIKRGIRLPVEFKWSNKNWEDKEELETWQKFSV